jgi:prepilin-type N-terminal cleavage/methylation domain-containing protein
MELKKLKKTDEGFTLIESMAALTIMGVTLAYMMPMYMYSRLKIDHANRVSNALLVAQKIDAGLAAQKVSSLPLTGVEDITDPDILTSAGKVYSATVTYCPTISGSTGCRTNYRQIEIEVKYKDVKVYSVKSAFSEQQ